MKAKWLQKAFIAVAVAALVLAPIKNTYAAEDIAGGSKTIGEDGTAFDDKPPTSNNVLGSAGIGTKFDYEAAGHAIVYSITITAGAMVFNYDYGEKWDPETHTYKVGSSGDVNGGWAKDDRDGENNKITIQNDSNYPVGANLTYAHTAGGVESGPSVFNVDTEATTAVRGKFSLKSAIDNENFKLAEVNRMITIDTSGIIATNDKHKYYTLKEGLENAEYDNVMEVYFAYVGKPDNKPAASTGAVDAGTITVTIYTLKFESGTVVENVNND